MLSAQSNLLNQHSPSLTLWEGEPKSNLIRERPLLKTVGKDFKRDGKWFFPSVCVGVYKSKTSRVLMMKESKIGHCRVIILQICFYTNKKYKYMSDLYAPREKCKYKSMSHFFWMCIDGNISYMLFKLGLTIWLELQYV